MDEWADVRMPRVAALLLLGITRALWFVQGRALGHSKSRVTLSSAYVCNMIRWKTFCVPFSQSR